MVREGLDPLDERDAEKVRKKAEMALRAAKGVTFADVAERYLDAHEASWKNPKHRQQWRNTLHDYVLTVVGNMPVASVGTGEVMQILEALWRTKPETGSRVRGRIESILDYAKARGWRDGENAARWRGISTTCCLRAARCGVSSIMPRYRGARSASSWLR